jgi:LysM repeat protein
MDSEPGGHVEAEPGAERMTSGVERGGGVPEQGIDDSTAREPADRATGRLRELFEGRSPNATTCPFLRSDAFGQLQTPNEWPDPANRCAALDEPQAPSARQQELVCLTLAHANCPRYLRGSLLARQAALTVPRARTLTGAIFGAILILIASSAASFAFVLSRGGLEIPVASPPGNAAVATPSQAAPTSAAVAPSAEPSPSPAVSLAPSVEPSTSPVSPPSTKPTQLPTATPAATASPASDRFALLDACPDKPNCYIYTIRAGDNLYSIAHYFGVSLQKIYQLNPWTRTSGLRPGRELILPTPTR